MSSTDFAIWISFKIAFYPRFFILHLPILVLSVYIFKFQRIGYCSRLLTNLILALYGENSQQLPNPRTTFENTFQI